MKVFLFRAVGVATAISIMFYAGCSSNDEPGPADCSTLDITVPTANRHNPTSCGTNDGSIAAEATGGSGPYQYALNGGAFQSGAEFTGLGAGEYSIVVRDANNCEKTISGVTLAAPGSNVNFTTAVVASGCGSSNGSITVTASGGSGSYSYRLGSGDFGTANVFQGLSGGDKQITVRDNANNCSITKSVKILSGTSFSADVKPILETRCAVSGCHVSGGAAPFTLTSFANAAAQAAAIKSATQNGTMPKEGGPLNADQKNKIACWVDDGAPNN